MGRWIEDPRELPSGFRYIKDADPLGQDPATTSLPTPYTRPVDYDEHRDYPVTPAPLDLVDVPPRVDDWCEDRPPAELADEDGTD